MMVGFDKFVDSINRVLSGQDSDSISRNYSEKDVQRDRLAAENLDLNLAVSTDESLIWSELPFFHRIYFFGVILVSVIGKRAHFGRKIQKTLSCASIMHCCCHEVQVTPLKIYMKA